jgi:hypothetical protein
VHNAAIMERIKNGTPKLADSLVRYQYPSDTSPYDSDGNGSNDTIKGLTSDACPYPADETTANDVLDLALHLAKGMLRSALEDKPELIIPIVREAIGYLPVLQQPALIQLHPDDAAIVRAAMGEELDKGGWRIAEDAGMARGGCRVDTASNQIDAQAASRWARLTHSLQSNVDWLGN